MITISFKEYDELLKDRLRLKTLTWALSSTEEIVSKELNFGQIQKLDTGTSLFAINLETGKLFEGRFWVTGNDNDLIFIPLYRAYKYEDYAWYISRQDRNAAKGNI